MATITELKNQLAPPAPGRRVMVWVELGQPCGLGHGSAMTYERLTIDDETKTVCAITTSSGGKGHIPVDMIFDSTILGIRAIPKAIERIDGMVERVLVEFSSYPHPQEARHG